ncbi:MAG: site-2 protease family protein, partial [Akkermansia sp.]
MSELLSFLSSAAMIVIVVLFFNLMIFVHELGHFWAGRWRGAYIDRFQIWFGKPIWKKKINGVEWGLGWIPAGGCVSLPQLGDMEAIEGAVDPEVAKTLKPLKPLDKIIIAAAGPRFSFLLAVFFAVIVWFVGTKDLTLPSTIGYVLPDSPAAAAGLKAGDKVTAIDGQGVDKWAGNMEGVSELIAMSEHESITFDIDRNGESLTLTSTFELPESNWWQRSGMRSVGIAPATGTEVGAVNAGAPADKAGLKAGDIIISVNGESVYSPIAVVKMTEADKPLALP